jgi:hypothetical protein
MPTSTKKMMMAAPSRRPLKVYAFDPSLGRMLGNHLTLNVRYEPLAPGPIGARFAVIDYDGNTKRYYAPIDLDDTTILLNDGLEPTESDPRFHQQMVYAVASETLERFEVALGRRIGWRHGLRNSKLNLHPHAMLEANAFYSREAHGILFGYFSAGDEPDGNTLPGQTIFTCLSHDIIAHEVTHAVIDGIRQHFTEPTNIDVAAFHEAFADLAALFRHFSHQEALLETLQRTGGLLYGPSLAAESVGVGTSTAAVGAGLKSDNPLVNLARQFGQVSGHGAGLRGALDKPANANDIKTKTEPHARGAILVAAMFDAYFTTYIRRTADIFRIYRAGGGGRDSVDLPGPLAEMLADRASKTAEMFFQICARALDYCPPVDITFGDFLRAVVTADADLYPVDAHSVRDAIMQAFRRRGIVPEGAKYFSEESLRWPEASADLPPVAGLVFGDPNGLTKQEKDINGLVLRNYAKAHGDKLGFDLKRGKISVPSFHPMFRLGEDGVLRIDMVVEMIQTKEEFFDPAVPKLGKFSMRAGVTLMIANQPIVDDQRCDPKIRFVIEKHSSGGRLANQRSAYAFGAYLTDQRIDFSLVHGV